MKNNFLIVVGFFVVMITMAAGSYVATKYIIRDVVIHTVKPECLKNENTIREQGTASSNGPEAKKEKLSGKEKCR